MTTTLTPAPTGTPGGPPRGRRRWIVPGVAAVVAAAGLGLGFGLSAHQNSTADSAAYRYYQSVVGQYGPGAMMGGGPVGGAGGYAWMMGGIRPPGWMTGSGLPGYMMGSAADPGEAMGSLFADAPGPRVSSDRAAALARTVPAGAAVDRTANRVTFAGGSVSVTVVASPPGADDKFEVAGLVNPTVVVPAGAAVSLQFVNADSTSAHGLVVAGNGAAASWMPMAGAAAAFPGASVWFLGDATSAGAHVTTLTFTATTAGHYQYLCPVPGHAQKGMVGDFVVAG